MLDLATTTIALQETCCGQRLERDVVTAVGEEAASYLHGQVSQNITGLTVGQSAMTMVLSPQGRIDAWARVTRVEDQSFWIDVEPGFGQQLLARLERFKLRTKVEFVLVTMAMISVRGPKSPAPVSALPKAIDVPVLWAETAGFDRLGPTVVWPEGIDEGDPRAFEAARIRSGFPLMGAEVGEKTIPAELGIVDLSADFSKGCYVGQELVARVDSRGNNTPRRLWGVEIEGGTAAVGDAIVMGDDAVGVITSCAPVDGGAVALASIVRSADVPGSAQVNGAVARIVALPSGVAAG